MHHQQIIIEEEHIETWDLTRYALIQNLKIKNILRIERMPLMKAYMKMFCHGLKKVMKYRNLFIDNSKSRRLGFK